MISRRYRGVEKMIWPGFTWVSGAIIGKIDDGSSKKGFGGCTDAQMHTAGIEVESIYTSKQSGVGVGSRKKASRKGSDLSDLLDRNMAGKGLLYGSFSDFPLAPCPSTRLLHASFSVVSLYLPLLSLRHSVSSCHYLF
jgi:hypothetical protein